MSKRQKCTFHNVPPSAVDLISSSIALRTKYNQNTNEISCSCGLTRANQIRFKLPDFLSQYPQIWFSTNLPDDRTPANIEHFSNEITVSFGSLLSTSKFLVHEVLFNDRATWTMTLSDAQTLVINCQYTDKIKSSVHLTLSMNSPDKTVFVIDGDNHSHIILNLNKMIKDVRKKNTTTNSRLNGTDPIIESLTRCSDILIRISSKSDANLFLDYLRLKHRYQIFYTLISIEKYQYKSWDKIEFNWYLTSDAVYGIAMLHSLGYLFDDKYLLNEQLQATMVELADENQYRFYQIALKAYRQLKECHWLDLTTIFNQDQFNRIKILSKTHSSAVGVIHLTPTRMFIMPKENTKGHRAMRHVTFRDEKNFCLVYLKPDPPNVYLNDNTDYFEQMFVSGIEIGRDRFHLFGSSNSQTKEHSFWFIKASSLDEIQQKRLQLGELNLIENLGTYVARLGLWFSSSSPTDIQLIYCQNRREFDERVRRKETCVMSINDIERTNYCFTDGNGFISKGLARCVADKLSICSKISQSDSLPSAYQIRMAGCKGLVIVDPRSTFDQFYIQIRPSMKKFECDDWTLDICEYSQSMPTRLNNQIILLLSDLGVPNDIFFRLQQQWFEETPLRSIRSEFLLKNKIPLPVNECRFMYGCAFETMLESGTCFIRYQVLDSKGHPLSIPRYQCVEGPVIVTKNPCPYAGDMLILRAVDLPELHDLHDVIVFSTKGDRPDFHKIAGSDLDGDQYFVYWGREFHLQCTVPPLEYTGEKKTKHPTAITPRDVIQYYLSTIGATSYGEIYNLHAVIVDKNTEQHQQRTCQKSAIELARMFSSAIDSGKTGYVIDRNRIQKIREKYGQDYPDFLMKYGKPYYKSQSILGKLYRNALLYQKGKITELNQEFAHLSLVNSVLHASPSLPLNYSPMNTTATELVNSGAKKARYKSMDQAKK